MLSSEDTGAGTLGKVLGARLLSDRRCLFPPWGQGLAHSQASLSGQCRGHRGLQEEVGRTLFLKCGLKAGKFRSERRPEELGEATLSDTFSGN